MKLTTCSSLVIGSCLVASFATILLANPLFNVKPEELAFAKNFPAIQPMLQRLYATHQAHVDRIRRQSDGLGGMLQSFGGRLTTMRDSARDTLRPIGQALNPRPVFESVGRFVSSASTNTMTRGRDAFNGVRDFGRNSFGRVRDGVTDAMDSVRDTWEEFWDL